MKKKTLNHAKPSLTVFADASVYADRKVAGWGGWARGDDRKSVTLGGAMPYPANTQVAELWALALTLEELRTTGYMLETDVSMILQSDSLDALNRINGNLRNSCASKRDGAHINPIRKLSEPAREAFTRIEAALAHTQIVYLRHVRAHRGGETTRSWVNEMCDQKAKAGALGGAE